MAGKTLEDAIQMLIDNVESATEATAYIVSKKIKEDFEQVAKGTVDKYYEYKKGAYTRYGRQHNLYKVYTITTSVKKEKGGMLLVGTIQLDSEKLEGLYHSNSSKHQGSGSWESGGDVEADYVYENFISGRHPWTNGWIGRPTPWAEELEYKLIKKSPNVYRTLKKYTNPQTYGDQYFSKYVQDTLMKMLKVYL